MKVGQSYSRCVRDIVEGTVSIDDVLVVITRTDFDPHDDEQWKGIWQGYTLGGLSNPEWADYDLNNKDHEDKFRSVSVMLWDDGKLHQPRKFGARAHRSREVWLDVIPSDGDSVTNVAVKEAWNTYRVLRELSR
jgi:hypothetical protein